MICQVDFFFFWDKVSLCSSGCLKLPQALELLAGIIRLYYHAWPTWVCLYMFNLSLCVCLLVFACLWIQVHIIWYVCGGQKTALDFGLCFPPFLSYSVSCRMPMCITGYLAHELLGFFLFLLPFLLKEGWEYRCMLLYCYTCVLRIQTQGIMLAWQARYSLSHTFPAPNEF